MIPKKFASAQAMEAHVQKIMLQVLEDTVQVSKGQLTEEQIKVMQEKADEASYLSRRLPIYSGTEIRLKNQGFKAHAMPMEIIDALNRKFMSAYGSLERMYSVGKDVTERLRLVAEYEGKDRTGEILIKSVERLLQ